MDLSTATPVEIDTALALLYDVEQVAKSAQKHCWTQVESAVLSHLGYPRNGATAAQVSAEIREAVEEGASRSQARIAGFFAKYEDAVAAALEALLAQEPYDAEYDARGGWTRAFVVAGGHVHRSLRCSTCYPTTQFGWLPELSGSDEAGIVEQAGERACTVCYPTAPVATLARPSSLFHKDEIAAQEARQEREAKRAAAAATKAAKALEIDLSGFKDVYPSRIHTLAEAKSYLTDAADWGTHPYYPAGAVAVVAYAVAGKLGTTPDVEVAAAAKRAAKRR